MESGPGQLAWASGHPLPVNPLVHQYIVQRLLRRVTLGMNLVGRDKDNFIDRTFYCILTNKNRNLP